VSGPPEESSLGYSLLNGRERDYTVLCDWSRVAYVDKDFKAAFPIGRGGLMPKSLTDKNDREVSDSKEFFDTRQQQLLKLLKELSQFSSKAKG
jgi:membrane-anchored protein YejM (alkaline phosphatase superfamily)